MIKHLINYTKERNQQSTFKYFLVQLYVLRNQQDNLRKFETKVNEAIFVGYSRDKACRVYNLRISIVMKSVHDVSDYKKIYDLIDEKFHESLKFKNEGEDIHYESDEEIVEISNREANQSTDNPSSVKNQVEVSIDTSNEISVDNLPRTPLSSRSHDFTNSR